MEYREQFNERNAEKKLVTQEFDFCDKASLHHILCKFRKGLKLKQLFSKLGFTLILWHLTQSLMSVAGYSPDWARLRTAAVYWAPQDLATSRLLSICKALVVQLSGPGTLLLWWVSWTHCVSPGIGYTTLNYSFLLNHSPLWNIANFGLMQLFWDTKKISFINSILFLFAIRFGTS